MAFDFKKEFKELYAPKNKPSLITIPPINYLAVRGSGDPNVENGEYKQSIGLHIKKTSSGFQLFACLTLLPKKILIGLLLKQLRKRS